MKALVIFSGGQDSTTCLHWALSPLFNDFKEVEAISFNYGQKHSVELEQAIKICDSLNITLHIIDISFLNNIVESALTSNGDVNKLNDKGLPSSFVPNRNQIFITMAHSLAQKINATHLITGVCQTDYSGYPDCRESFVKAIEWTTNLGSDADIDILTPLMYLTKAETFELAMTMGSEAYRSVIEDSHTCYNGDRTTLHDWGYGCGECPACELRSKGFTEFKYLMSNTDQI